MRNIKHLGALCALLISTVGFSQSDITFQLDMNGYTGSFTTPEVNGTFNGWCGSSCHPMSDPDGDNIWEVTVDSLPAGLIEYKFAFDNWAGQEQLTPGDPCTMTTGSFTNRFYTVAANATLPPVCWGQCNPCSGGPVSTNVTFNVDMTGYANTSWTQLFVGGDFNSWCGNCNELLDPDGDSIYTGSVAVPISYDTIEYKFLVDNWTDSEGLLPGSACTVTDPSGQFTNRSLALNGDITLPAVCWASCDPCSAGPTSATVTFRVDMSNYSGSYTEVNLNGTFNNWCGSCAIMTDADGDSIYELDVVLPLGNVLFKYTLDGWTVDEQFAGGEPCTFDDGSFVNRTYDVTADATLSPYCWESCVSCSGSGFGLEEEQNSLSLSIRPNPGTDWIELGLPVEAGNGRALLECSDTRGVVVKRMNVDVVGGAYRMDVSELSGGVYVLSVLKDNSRHSGRFIKK